MKKTFIYYFYALLLSLLINTHILFCPGYSSPDTPEGIAYQVLFEQSIPLLDKAIDPTKVSETIATYFMLNRLENNIIKTIDNDSQKQLNKMQEKALKKIKDTIENIIKKEIINIIDQQRELFETHGKKGLLSRSAASARGWFAKKFSKDKTRLEDYKDYEFRHISPGYTDAAPGLIKNNLEFLYEQMFSIVLSSRKVGDLFALYVFFNTNQTDFISSKMDAIETARNALDSTLIIYINDLQKATFSTKDALLHFAKEYQNDANTIIKTVITYLKELSKNALKKNPKDKKEILTKNNIENMLTFLILPSSFLDTDVVTYTNDMDNEIAYLKTQLKKATEEKETARKEKVATEDSHKVKSKSTEKQIKTLEENFKNSEAKNKALTTELEKLKSEIENLKKEKTEQKEVAEIPAELKNIQNENSEPQKKMPPSLLVPTEIRESLLDVQNQLQNAKDIETLNKIEQALQNINSKIVEKNKKEQSNEHDQNLYEQLIKKLEQKKKDLSTKK